MSGRVVYLLIPEPESCRNCPIYDDSYDDCVLGGVTSEIKRPSECRFRPLPEKLRTEGKEPYQRAAGYAYGWNDCLDALESRAGLSEIERHFAERNINADLTDQEEMV